jgi:putative heme iron utilization protein
MSAYDGAMDADRMWKAYQLFYFAFLETQEKQPFRHIKDNLCSAMSDTDKVKVNKILVNLPKKSMTSEDKERKQRILQRLFYQESRTILTLKLYTSALETVGYLPVF